MGPYIELVTLKETTFIDVPMTDDRDRLPKKQNLKLRNSEVQRILLYGFAELLQCCTAPGRLPMK